MIEFMNAETHTPVLLMNHLQSLREERIWVNTVLKLTSLKTEIARSVRRPKSQEFRAEDALAEGAVPRAENFGDLITADHKVLSGGCESRNNHRYAVVVQDLPTQWIQPVVSVPNKNFSGNRKDFANVLGAEKEA